MKIYVPRYRTIAHVQQHVALLSCKVYTAVVVDIHVVVITVLLLCCTLFQESERVVEFNFLVNKVCLATMRYMMSKEEEQ